MDLGHVRAYTLFYEQFELYANCKLDEGGNLRLSALKRANVSTSEKK